jgi:hypothetical protein
VPIIELCDKRAYDGKTSWGVGVILYHHWDGYPAWMGPELDRILKQVKTTLNTAGFSYWWDSERVGALMIKLSADSTSYNGVPRFQPCTALHGDIDYLWRVLLGTSGEYDIQCFRVNVDWETGRIRSTQPIEWRKEAERVSR